MKKYLPLISVLLLIGIFALYVVFHHTSSNLPPNQADINGASQSTSGAPGQPVGPGFSGTISKMQAYVTGFSFPAANQNTKVAGIEMALCNLSQTDPNVVNGYNTCQDGPDARGAWAPGTVVSNVVTPAQLISGWNTFDFSKDSFTLTFVDIIKNKIHSSIDTCWHRV